MSGLNRTIKRNKQKIAYKKFCVDWQKQIDELVMKRELSKLSDDEAFTLQTMMSIGKPRFADYLKRLALGKKIAEARAESARKERVKEVEKKLGVNESSWDELVI